MKKQNKQSDLACGCRWLSPGPAFLVYLFNYLVANFLNTFVPHFCHIYGAKW